MMSFSTLFSILKVAGVTVIIGQACKVIDKKEFKALVDFCGVATIGLIIAQKTENYIQKTNNNEMYKVLKEIYNVVKNGVDFIVSK